MKLEERPNIIKLSKKRKINYLNIIIFVAVLILALISKISLGLAPKIRADEYAALIETECDKAYEEVNPVNMGRCYRLRETLLKSFEKEIK